MGDLNQKRLATMDLPFRGTDEARRYKVIDAIVNIDMQDPAATLIRPRKTPLTTRMECAISPRKLYAAAAAMGSNSRTTSCGQRSRIAGRAEALPAS
jgi:hypothetical protein